MAGPGPPRIPADGSSPRESPLWARPGPVLGPSWARPGVVAARAAGRPGAAGDPDVWPSGALGTGGAGGRRRPRRGGAGRGRDRRPRRCGPMAPGGHARPAAATGKPKRTVPVRARPDGTGRSGRPTGHRASIGPVRRAGLPGRTRTLIRGGRRAGAPGPNGPASRPNLCLACGGGGRDAAGHPRWRRARIGHGSDPRSPCESVRQGPRWTRRCVRRGDRFGGDRPAAPRPAPRTAASDRRRGRWSRGASERMPGGRRTPRGRVVDRGRAPRRARPARRGHAAGTATSAPRDRSGRMTTEDTPHPFRCAVSRAPSLGARRGPAPAAVPRDESPCRRRRAQGLRAPARASRLRARPGRGPWARRAAGLYAATRPRGHPRRTS